MTGTGVALARAEAGLDLVHGDLPPRVERAVQLARGLGAPLAPVLRSALQVEAARSELVRAVEVAAAEGRAVARALVLAPPLLGPATALLVTDAPFAVWATGGGQLVLAVALVLWGIGALLVRRMVRGATAVPAAGIDELLDLAAVAVTAGLTVPRALRVAAPLARATGPVDALALWLELGAAGPPPGPWDEIGLGLAAAQHDGLPSAPLLRAIAADRRQAAHHQAMQRAARLGARLSVPTTLLLLPAAGLVVAAPLLHGLVTSLG